MTTSIQELPIRIVQAIEQERLSTNHVIYYDVQHGWICQQRDNTSVNPIPKLNEQNAYTGLDDNIQPLEKLGPFGK
jgi:hypothetical protein